MLFFFFKHKTAYDMRISDWSSDVCSSDLPGRTDADPHRPRHGKRRRGGDLLLGLHRRAGRATVACHPADRHLRGADRTGRGAPERDRKSVVTGTSVSVRVALGGRRIIKNIKSV